MPKGRSRKQQPIPTPPAPESPGAQVPFTVQVQPPTMKQMLGYDPHGKIVPVDVAESKTAWSEFKLEDGTTVRVKGVLIDVKKAVDQYAADGKPVYIAQMTLVNDFVVPEELMQKK